MLRFSFSSATALAALALVTSATAHAATPVQGTYVEARTCQVYTGPCFANGEVGSTGKDAIMTWSIAAGEFAGVDLADKSVALVIRATDTLGFNGLKDAKSKRAIVIIDESANSTEASALKQFALAQTGLTNEEIADEYRAPITMDFDFSELTASVQVGKFAALKTRKARKGDCICSNESAYYPPLTKLEGFVPGVTIEGDVSARSLGTRWSIPDSRTAYLGTFRVKTSGDQLASSL
jgi:hypothetical protein